MQTQEILPIGKQKNPNRLNSLKLRLSETFGLASDYLTQRIPIIKNAVEKIKGVPKVNLMFFQETHSEYKNKTEHFMKMFQRADVIVLEAGSTVKDFFLQNASTNNITGVWSEVVASQKPVYFIDPPKEDSIWQERKEYGRKAALKYDVSYDLATQRMREFVERDVDMHKYRERVWESQLTDIIKELRSSDLFRKKPIINVMVQVGAYHTQIYHKLSKKGGNITTERVFSHNPYIYTHITESQRKVLFKNHILTSEDMAKIMAEYMIGQFFRDEFNWRFSNKTELEKYIRSVVGTFDQDKAVRAYNDLVSVNKDGSLGEKATYNARKKQLANHLPQNFKKDLGCWFNV